jgi:hypothetical protein
MVNEPTLKAVQFFFNQPSSLTLNPKLKSVQIFFQPKIALVNDPKLKSFFIQLNEPTKIASSSVILSATFK